MPTPKKIRCANIKNRNSPNEQCIYTTTTGEFCSRHSKHPHRFSKIQPVTTRFMQDSVKIIQRFWRLRHSLELVRERGLAFFNRSICHNNTELASFEPLQSVARDYFFVIHEGSRFWGFDIRTLLIQYEIDGKLENPYTKEICSAKTLERFRSHIYRLRKWKKSLHYEQLNCLSPMQTWNLRVLDLCLRLDMLGYRIATQWFTDLDILNQKRLYISLYTMWNETLNLTEQQKRTIVPKYFETTSPLFMWTPEQITVKREMDSIRRTNLNIMERLISSANDQSDKTLGAMYVVMSLCKVSYKCKTAYPWIS